MGRSSPNPEQAHPTGLGQENLGSGLLSKKSWNLTTSVSLFSNKAIPENKRSEFVNHGFVRDYEKRIIEEERRRITPRPPSASKGRGLTIEPAQYSGMYWLAIHREVGSINVHCEVKKMNQYLRSISFSFLFDNPYTDPRFKHNQRGT